jgi:hypothetical protein
MNGGAKGRVTLPGDQQRLNGNDAIFIMHSAALFGCGRVAVFFLSLLKTIICQDILRTDTQESW